MRLASVDLKRSPSIDPSGVRIRAEVVLTPS